MMNAADFLKWLQVFGLGGPATVTWANVTGKPTFAAVAFSGAWADIVGKPTLFSGAWADLTGKPSFATVAFSGSYNDLLDKPAIVINAPSRALVNATNAQGFQVSATRNADVRYEGTFSTTSTIGGPAAVTVFLETANTNSANPGDWTIVAKQVNSNSITLAVVLQQVDVEPWALSRVIPAGKWVRLRVGAITGTASAAINPEQQEVLL